MSGDRQRISIACEPCRRGKRKCDGSRPCCDLCRRRSKRCEYGIRLPSSSRRYVHSNSGAMDLLSETDSASSKHTEELLAEIEYLKAKVESLGESSSERSGQPDRPHHNPNIENAASEGFESHGVNLLSNAAREISQLTQRRVNPGGPGSTSIYLLEPNLDRDPSFPAGWDVIPSWPSRMHDSAFRRASFQCFIERINSFEGLIDEDYISQLTPSLDQPYHMLVLLLAIIGAATVVTREHSIGDGCVQCAERMVMRACVSPEATLVVARALTVLVWRELTVGGNPTRTWMFNCMASALLQQLGVFDWSPETIAEQQQDPDFREKLAVFWSFSAVDRICAALLGRMSSIPWRHNIQIPRYILATTPGAPVTIEMLYFDQLWALWKLHGNFMTVLYTPQFDLMPECQRQSLRLDCRKALMDLKESMDSRLRLDSNKAGGHPFLYFLQMAFDTSPITLNLPFLARSGNEQVHCLQEMVQAASSHTELLFRFRKMNRLTDSPPVVIYYTVRAATIHLLLATSTDLTVQRRSWRRLKICLESLEEIQNIWERQASRAIRYIQRLAARWGVTKALPLKLSHPLSSGADNVPPTVPDHAIEPFDAALSYDLPPTDLDITAVELDIIQWAISQDNACQLLQSDTLY